MSLKYVIEVLQALKQVYYGHT